MAFGREHDVARQRGADPFDVSATEGADDRARVQGRLGLSLVVVELVAEIEVLSLDPPMR